MLATPNARNVRSSSVLCYRFILQSPLSLKPSQTQRIRARHLLIHLPTTLLHSSSTVVRSRTRQSQRVPSRSNSLSSHSDLIFDLVPISGDTLSPSSRRVRNAVVDALTDGVDPVADAVYVAAHVVAVACDVGLYGAVDPVLGTGRLLGLRRGRWVLGRGWFEGVWARSGFGGCGARSWRRFDRRWRFVGGVLVGWWFDWWRFLGVGGCCGFCSWVGHF